MLTEFAFTPSIFDEDAHEDKEAWRDQLKELGHNMFPRVSAWPVVVSDLYAGSWNQIADQTVKAIKDQRARFLCEGILQNMKKTLVTRPVCGDWPDEDVAWCREAVASSSVEPIERIVADAKSKSALLEECKFIRSLDEVENGGFWQGIGSESSPRMIISDQVKLLRKLCLHSEWVALISKDIYGGSDDETDFALGVIDAALNRPAGFGGVDFELHTEGPRRFTDQADYEAKKSGVVNAISGSVKATLSGSQSVDLLVWPKLLDRFLIAGTYTTESGGVKKKSPRWGVLLSHIARRPDQSKPDFFTEWKLLNRESLNRWFGKYVADSAPSKPTPTHITPVT